MKKSILSLSILALAFSVSSCDLQVGVDSVPSLKVSFSTSGTKTVIGALDDNAFPVLWNDGDGIEISLNENTETRDLAVNVSVENSPSEAATWSYDFGEALSADGIEAPYTFSAFYPGSNVRAFYYNYEHKIKIEDMPSVQTPTTSSCDPKAMFVYSISESFTEFPNEVTMPAFEHMSAYACITLGTGIPSDAVVESVTVTANAGTHLCGPAWFWYADDAGNTKGDWTDHSTTTDANCTIKINTSSKSNIWMGCRPTTDLTSLTFEVVTDKGAYTKTVSTTKQLQAGKVATMTVNGFAPAGKLVSYVWSVVTNNMVMGQCTATDQKTVSDADYAKMSWTGTGAGSVVTYDVASPEGEPDMTWTFTGTAATGLYYVANGVSNNRVKIGTGTNILTSLVIDVPISDDIIIKKVSVWSSIADAKSTAEVPLSIRAKAGNEYIIGSSSAGVPGSVSTTAAQKTGFEKTSGDIFSQGLTGPVQVIIDSAYPYYLFKIQVDCIELDD